MTSTTAGDHGARFVPVDRCWACEGDRLTPYHEFRLDYRAYETQDPELFAYTGEPVRLVRCAACGFGQPDKLPSLPRFFDRMYDQHWSEEWVEREFESEYRDFIFSIVLRELGRRVQAGSRRLLDIGAHAGRFMYLAQRAGWDVEGIELNPRTAAAAVRHTGAPVHQVNAHTLAGDGRRYDAVTLTDVLEHIPEPVTLLSTVARLMAPGGCLAIKVPCGRSQWRKERVRAAISSHKVSVADNLVHVNHFSPASLTRAIERAGFRRVRVYTGAPELQTGDLPVPIFTRTSSNAFRLGVYAAARLPGALYTPLALNLQAFAEFP